MPGKETAIKHSTILATYILIIWGFYRILFKLPDEIEELFIKPVVWLLPVFYFLRKERAPLSSIGITGKNLFSSIYLGLALGVLFTLEGVFINYLKYGDFNFQANIGSKPLLASLGLSFVTAFSEELSFRGYLFNRVWKALDNVLLANLLTSIVWALIHVPVTIFVWNLGAGEALTYLFLTTIFGIGSAFIFAKTGNIASSVFLHVLWEWPIVLFR